jgi:hypothetical protein
MTYSIRRSLAPILIFMALTPLTAGAQGQADRGLEPDVATVGTFAGDSGLWYVSSAELLPAGAMSAGIYRVGEARNQGATETSAVGMSFARGMGGQERPKYSMAAEATRALNRRAEIVVR